MREKFCGEISLHYMIYDLEQGKGGHIKDERRMSTRDQSGIVCIRSLRGSLSDRTREHSGTDRKEFAYPLHYNLHRMGATEPR